MKRFWLLSAFAGLVIIGVACVKSLSGPLNADFTMFWRSAELAYPPPYLLLIKPLGALPYGVAFPLWIVLTGVVYVATSPKPKMVALGNPAAVFNGLIGQNGFLTAGILFAGLRELTRNPFRAGAILGLLVIKPHLAPMLPVAVIAGRLWHAIPSALGTAALLCITALLTFGWDAYRRFFELGSMYGALLSHNGWHWNEVASFYGFAKWFGASEPAAWTLHIGVAAAAAIAVWVAWRNDFEGKVPLTAVASLLISPYLFTYDAVLLTAALAWLRGPRAIAVWALAALPLLRLFFGYDCPDTIPLAAAFSVYAIAAQDSPLRPTLRRSHIGTRGSP